MHITTGDAIKLFNGLASLDGIDRVVTDGQSEKVVRDYFQISGVIRMRIARIMIALQAVVDAHTTARNALITSIGKGAGSLTQPADIAAFEQQMAAMLAERHTVEIATISEADLDLEKNRYPIATLIAIAPILTGPN